MKILYFDCFSGISGDMAVGALLDLGVPFSYLKFELNKLGITEEYELSLDRVKKCGISANSFGVSLTHQHEHDHEHNHDHAHPHTHSRSYGDIVTMIQKSELNEKVKDLSLGIFHEVAKAEAAVHETELDLVVFHEVGAVDSIVDIVGAAICIDYLKPDKIYVSVLTDGTGFVKCQHGVIPVPVPAVVEIAKNTALTINLSDIKTELVTPTGAAIAGYLAEQGKLPDTKIINSGYGAGKKNFEDRPNLLRVILGELEHSLENKILVIETNIDNMTGEGLGFVMDKLFSAGALDVFYTSIYMKKNRPAVKLTVLTRQEHEQEITDVIFLHTTTIGIRKYETARVELVRHIEEIETEFGTIRIKVCEYNGELKKTPEFEDVKKICEEFGLSFTKVYDNIKKLI